MDRPVCARCGKPQAEHFIPFAVVTSDTGKTQVAAERRQNGIKNSGSGARVKFTRSLFCPVIFLLTKWCVTSYNYGIKRNFGKRILK